MDNKLMKMSLPVKRRSTLKGKDLIKNYIKHVINLNQLKDYLEKSSDTRTRTEQECISRFLIDNYSYFHQFHNDSFKLDKLINVLEIETFKPNETIINYGDSANKFYVLLLGTVSICKPIFNQKEMCLGDFIKYARNVKYHSPKAKYERLKEMNNFLSLDIDYLIKSNEHQKHQSKFIFQVEGQEKINEMSQGFSFGEVALIKKTKRNATILAQTKCTLASIKKASYNKIIKECEETKFEKRLIEVKRKYSFFSQWTHHELLGLLNCFTRLELMKGQYLYKQNTDPDGIYILETGSVEMFSLISYDWINDLYAYIIDSKTNLVFFLYNQYHISKHSLKVLELNNLIDKLKQKAIKSPFNYNPYKKKHILLSNEKKQNIIDIKREEDEYNDPFHLIKVLIKKSATQEVFGFIECIEMKKRICSIQITSSSAIIQKVNLNDFYKLLNSIEEDANWLFILDLIAKSKYHFNHQLQKQIKSKSQLISDLLDYKYESVLSSLSINEPSIKKICEKIKGFGRYDKDSIYYIDPAKRNDKKKKSNHNDLNRHLSDQTISIMSNNESSILNSKIIRSESMSSLIIKQNKSEVQSLDKRNLNKGLKRNNNLNIFHSYKIKPFIIQSTMGRVSINSNSSNKTKQNKTKGKMKKEQKSLSRLFSSSAIKSPSPLDENLLFKKRQHKNTFSVPTIFNNADKTSTIMTTILKTRRSNNIVNVFNNSNSKSNQNYSNALFTKELILSKEYCAYLNKQPLKTSKLSLKNSIL